MTPEQREVLLGLLQVLNRAHGKSFRLLEQPALLHQEEGKGAMGFRDVIAHQYFDLDVEQIMVICEQSLPDLLRAVQELLNS